jgi:hypothetical protein
MYEVKIVLHADESDVRTERVALIKDKDEAKKYHEELSKYWRSSITNVSEEYKTKLWDLYTLWAIHPHKNIEKFIEKYKPKR